MSVELERSEGHIGWGMLHGVCWEYYDAHGSVWRAPDHVEIDPETRRREDLSQFVSPRRLFRPQIYGCEVSS